MLVKFLRKFASLKVTCLLLVAFMMLLFWGVLAQASAGDEGGVAFATERFFESYFLWAMGIVPIPAFKSMAVIAVFQLLCSLAFRMPKGLRNLGLWGMHIALIILLAGGIAESEVKREYSGFRVVNPSSVNVQGHDSAAFESATFFAVDDSLRVQSVKIPDGYPYAVFYKGRVDMMGTQVDVYTATYDPFRFVPYAFAILFLLSAIFHGLSKAKRKPQINACLLVAIACAFVANPAQATLPETPVLLNGEIRTYDSFSRGVLDDFCGKVRMGGMGAIAIVDSIALNTEHSAELNLFKILRSDVQQALNLPQGKRYVSYRDLQQSRNLLELYASRTDDHPATAEMKRLLSNVQTYEDIAQGKIPQIVQQQVATQQGRKRERLSAEVFYNHANFALIAFIFAFIGGTLALTNSALKKRGLDIAANVISGFSAVVLAIAFVLRFYIAERPPLSSLYEIVLLVALLLASFELGAFLFCRRRTFTLMVPVIALTAILLFFAKFVLEPGNLFQAIPAVLNSSVFLTLHVFTIALGFAGVILSGVVAHVVLWRAGGKAQLLESLNANKPIAATFRLLNMTLGFGAFFTIVGTLLGGVWADFAWGRFWGFDPKECGALFVILWTMLGLHLRLARVISAYGFTLFNCFNVTVTFLCWFGINLLGVGLHSYGFQGGTALWLVTFIVLDSLAIFLLRNRSTHSS